MGYLEAFDKMKAAKQLEKEALVLMFPESVIGHFEVISDEVKAILIEVLRDKKEQSVQKKTVKKVDIG